MREQAGDDVSGKKQNEAGSNVQSLSTVGTGVALQPGRTSWPQIILGRSNSLNAGQLGLGCNTPLKLRS